MELSITNTEWGKSHKCYGTKDVPTVHFTQKELNKRQILWSDSIY